MTEFLSADPAPRESDFCGSNPSVVAEDFDRSFLEGTWTVDASSFLTTIGTLTPQAGSLAARPLGIIHRLTCRVLILFPQNLEGPQPKSVIIYRKQDSSAPDWVPI
ncbi:hypothetical protein [Parafilimonas sp.]|uniref:hypothetical protein n=1 Tax=Parafilimonas sp. TaxID=1969739 RepID=UPI0039E288CE